ncbi:MAG TPA: aminoglycoside phosphotransferase family protein [Acidimicrobiales bacterium]|nr:aminoglycoside phosphotransferase family protein [Acidimicrobiales bacterium]
MENVPETVLRSVGSGEQVAKGRRRGDVVLRPSGPWSRSVIALLRHLEAVGFTAAPPVVGTGFAEDGRETLGYVVGESPQPRPWSDEAVHDIGVLLRRLHDATASFTPPADARWQLFFGRQLPGSEPVISHNDLGPWNIIAQEGRPVAFVDWEFAGPVDARWDLAHTAWLNAQLHDDDVAEMNGLGTAADRARQLRQILDGFGLPLVSRVGFVDTMVEFAVHCARAEAVRAGVTLTSPAVDATGFPVLWAVTWMIRSASWMLRHRALLDAAITASG